MANRPRKRMARNTRVVLNVALMFVLNVVLNVVPSRPVIGNPS
jgi:hypothetical protein